MDYSKINMQKKDRLAEIAYKEIKNAIFNCTIKPGDCVSGTQLAKLLKMSRTPIREAINTLANEGLVEIQNGVGIFVKGITIREIKELFQVRAILEVAILKQCIDRIPLKALNEVKQKWLTFKEKLSANMHIDLAQISELDFKTHNLINSHSSNTYLKELMSNIYLQVERIQYMSAQALGDTRQTIDEHLELISFIEHKDVVKACESLETHINNAVFYLINNPSDIEL